MPLHDNAVQSAASLIMTVMNEYFLKKLFEY